MVKLRFIFEKTTPAHLMSHLDLLHVFQRAFVRADVPLHFSEGFNPHAYVSIAVPLPVGAVGLREPLDFGMDEYLGGSAFLSSLPARMNACLPSGVRVLEAALAAAPVSKIQWARYEIELFWDEGKPEDALPTLTELFTQTSLPVEKKSKGKVTTQDIAPMMQALTFTDGDASVRLNGLLTAGTTVLSPQRLLDAIAQHRPDYTPTRVRMVREGFFDAALNAFA